MKFSNIKYLVIASSLLLVSCDSFLDKIPDNRVELKTPEQLTQLLVNGYSKSNYALLCEFSADNFIDNNSPDENGNRYNLASYDKIDNEAYAWQDVVSDNQEDSPSDVWTECYHAIAVANAVLDKVAEFEADGRGDEVSAQKGEALLIRAYNHFILANIFCPAYRGPELSKSIQGIPYATKTETQVLVQYERLPLSEVYDKIKEDLLAGLPLIDDNNYEIPKYHFNKKAANAFAARFFLYARDYENVEKYATIALGGNAGKEASYMRQLWATDFTTFNSLVQGYVSAESQSNFMLVATTSVFQRRYSGKYRYTINRETAKATIYGPGPTYSYSFHPCYSGKLYVSGAQEYGVWFPKSGELFEYTDKVAGIGYCHIVRCEFTAEETLLCRAEARIYLNRIDDAVKDLKIWDDSRKNTTVIASFYDLTRSRIESYYKKDNGYGVVKPLHIDEVYPCNYTASAEAIPYLQCVLHFRRIETILDGYRWFDIKRYGIEITHKIGQTKVETLTWNDPRRALQLPSEVIAAGIEETNRRLITPEDNSSYSKITTSYK